MKKTMQTIINGISEKLERFIDSIDKKFDLAGDLFKKLQNQVKALHAKNQKRADAIKTLDDKIKELEQKANRTGQFHLDAVNEKFDKLDKKINDNKDNCVSYNDYKKLWEENTHDYNVLARKRLDDYTKGVENAKKIEVLEKKVDNMLMLEQDIDRKVFARMDSIEQNIPDINQETDETRALKEYCDNLEGKYYTLRSELDSIYKVLEMDALDIQDLYNKLENHPKKKNINLTEKEGCYDE